MKIKNAVSKKKSIERALQIRLELFNLANSFGGCETGDVAVLLHSACNNIMFANEKFLETLSRKGMTDYFFIIESCVQPSGVYERTVASFSDLQTAQDAFLDVIYSGPETDGVQRWKKLCLIYKDEGGMRKIVDTRDVD